MNGVGLHSFVPLAVLVLSTLAYQVSQLSISAGLHLVLSSVCVFVWALLGALVAAALCSGRWTIAGAFEHLSAAHFVSGISVVGIVVGNLLCYRMGWEINSLPVFSYGVVCVLLVPVGYCLYRESLTLVRIVGILVTLAGLYLLSKKG